MSDDSVVEWKGYLISPGDTCGLSIHEAKRKNGKPGPTFPFFHHLPPGVTTAQARELCIKVIAEALAQVRSRPKANDGPAR
ncbi:MAG TPA: hypothetical protein VM537_05835 [Anaerolineae bacterium]|nr:hypothetical protein [Anaerolineae bacterium]